MASAPGPARGSQVAKPAQVHLLVIISAFGVLPTWRPIKTSEVHVTCVRLHEVANAFNQLTSKGGQVIVNSRRQTIRVTDVAWDVDRMMHVARAIQRPAARDQRIWFAYVRGSAASDVARNLKELFDGGEWLPGERISAIIPDDRGKQLIVVANERGYARIRRLIVGCPDPKPDDVDVEDYDEYDVEDYLDSYAPIE